MSWYWYLVIYIFCGILLYVIMEYLDNEVEEFKHEFTDSKLGISICWPLIAIFALPITIIYTLYRIMKYGFYKLMEKLMEKLFNN